jgi:uroporphyrin-III C-methyltransferase
MSVTRLIPGGLSIPGPELEPGHVWLVGAGPGDPGHLTLHALCALSQADTIIHDALVGADVLALARPDADCISVGKRGGQPSARQDDITALIIDKARQGKRIVRLKGGDPFIFGRGGEECWGLAKAAVPYRIVPGVSAGLAAPTVANIPLTMRGINQAVFLATGHGAGETGDADAIDWQVVAKLNQPIVLYMAVSKMQVIRDELVAGGMRAGMPVAIVQSATLPEEKLLITTLGTMMQAMRAEGVGSPAIIVIGDVVSVRDQLSELAEQARAELDQSSSGHRHGQASAGSSKVSLGE